LWGVVPNRFAAGKYSIAECDRCGWRFKLTALRKLTIKTKQVNIKVCPACWEMDHPQLQLGMYPVDDPQAVREPRPDISYPQSRSYTATPFGQGVALFVGQVIIVGALVDNALTTEAGSQLLTEGGSPVVYA
jgi:hypothetical protein